MQSILVCDDDKQIVEAIDIYLTGEGFEVIKAYDGAEALRVAREQPLHLIIMDIMMPRMDGIQATMKIREEKNTPIIMVSAKKDDIDKIRGLGLGADDYMTKPFAPEELLARVRAISRRQGEVVLDELRFSDLTLGLATSTLTCGAKSVRLSFKEKEVLRILMANPFVITPKEELISRVWGVDSEAEDNNVEAYISFLRKKFAYLGSQSGIETVRKVGYRLEDTAQ